VINQVRQPPLLDASGPIQDGDGRVVLPQSLAANTKRVRAKDMVLW
jgi:hypothetical protein